MKKLITAKRQVTYNVLVTGNKPEADAAVSDAVCSFCVV